MKLVYTICLLALFAVAIYIAPAVAGTVVEADVRDASGKVLLGETILESDIPALVGYLVNGGVEAEYSRNILIEFGGSAVPELIKAMPELVNTIKANTGSGAGNAVSVLSGIKDERLVVPLSKYIDDPDSTVAGSVKGVLVSYGDLSIPVMLDMLKDPGSHDSALNVLSRTTPSENKLKLVRPLLSSDNTARRGDAVMLLGTWHDKASEQDITKLLLGDPDPMVRRSAARGYFELHWLEPTGFDADVLLKSLKDADPVVRTDAVDMLSRGDDKRVEAAMLGLLGTDKDHTVVAKAAEALANMNSTSAAFPILKLLDKNDPDQANYQATIVWALGELKAKEAVPYLLEPLAGDAPVDEDVLHETLNALLKIGEQVDLTPVLKYLDPGKVGDGCCGDDQTDLMLKLIEAYAKPGDEKVKDAVIRFKPYARANQLERVDNILERL